MTAYIAHSAIDGLTSLTVPDIMDYDPDQWSDDQPIPVYDYPDGGPLCDPTHG